MSDNPDYEPYYVGDELRVTAIPGAVMVSMCDDNLTAFREVLELLVALLEHRDASKLRRRLFGTYWTISADRVLAQMFPDVYRDSASAAMFRQHHGPDMHAELLTATRRMLDWDGAAPVCLNAQDVDDWLMVIGVAQFLFVRRRRGALVTRPTAPAQQWLTNLMDQLVFAICPETPAAMHEAFHVALHDEQSVPLPGRRAVRK